MKPKFLLVLLALVLIVSLGACAPGDAQNGEGDAQEESNSDSGLVTGVEIAGFKFVPETVTIPVGGTVTWTNMEAAPHSSVGDNEEWDSGALRKNDSFSFTFDTPGTYTYHDYYYPAIHGTVEVTE